MFDDLDDPSPPTPTESTRQFVQDRARALHRRRLALRWGIVASTAVIVGLLVLGRPSGDRVDTGPVDDPSTTTSIPAGRGEEFSVDANRFAAQSVERSTEADPSARVFNQRILAEIDGEPLFVVERLEMPATSLAALAGRLGPEASSPEGRTYRSDVDDPNQIWWIIDENIAVRVAVNDPDLDPVEVLDAVDYEPPKVRCIIGDEVQTRPECGGQVDGATAVVSTDD